jgi:general nucleoside transport system permease protein
MNSDIFQTAIIISLLAATIRIATPILLAALGELIAEKSGIMNLGLEGTMLMGAFFGFVVAHQTGSIPLGIGAAMLAGVATSLVLAFMAITLKVDQIVTGLGINLLASGLTFYLYRIIYHSTTTGTAPTTNVLKIIEIPLLSKIPFLGEILFSHSILTYGALLMVPAIWFFLFKTKYGLLIRCLGENPRAVDMKGISVIRLQYLAVLFGGMLGGVAGSYLTIASVGMFVPDISAGRGWLAIVLVIAGNWNPWRILIAALLFAFLDAFQLQMQGLGVQLPYQLFLAMPYIFAILAMLGSRTKSRAPQALGVPYSRE